MVYRNHRLFKKAILKEAQESKNQQYKIDDRQYSWIPPSSMTQAEKPSLYSWIFSAGMLPPFKTAPFSPNLSPSELLIRNAEVRGACSRAP